jgi:hypothetical protein
MPPREKQPADLLDQELQRMMGLVGKHVLLGLGQPPGLHRVQVRELWQGRYRVNIFVGPDAASARVAHSYFLVVDTEGSVSHSTPPITRRY